MLHILLMVYCVLIPLKADQCTVEAENFHWKGEALIIGIGNGRQAGGGTTTLPRSTD